MFKNTLKIIAILVITLVFLGDNSFSAYTANSIQNSIIPTWSDSISAVDSWKLTINWNNSLLNNLINFLKDSMSSLIAIIAIWVFLYIWAKLVIARWNPEEFKKAITSFVYAVVWIFVVSVAWLAVKLVTGLDIN